MTIRDGALKVLEQYIIQLNQYSIDEKFAHSLAVNMLKGMRLQRLQGKKIQKPTVFFKEGQIRLEQFDQVVEALDFASNNINILGIVWKDSIVEWAPFRDGYVYKDIDTNKLEVIKSIK